MKKLQLLLLCAALGSQWSLLYSQTALHPESENGDMVKVYVRQDPSTYQKSAKQTTPIEFAVQVPASSHPISESKAKKEWSDLGHVYIQQENGMYKVRIGPYGTQLEAKQTLLHAKSKGRQDAFIVVLQGTQNDKPLYQSGMEQEKPSHDLGNQTASVTEMNDQMSPGMTDYKIRVVSYLKPGSFNPDGMDQLGKLESYRKGDLTILMVGGFRNLADAQKARQIVVAKGYKDATIVVEREGILEEVVFK